jgi:hypothetical protein
MMFLLQEAVLAITCLYLGFLAKPLYGERIEKTHLQPAELGLLLSSQNLDILMGTNNNSH